MNMENKKSVFETLNAIDCNEHTEQRGKLTYLSWAWAWQILKKNYPTATYTIYEDANGRFYHSDGRTAWVKTGVTVEGIENIEYLPIMDCYKKSITVDKLTSFDVNTAIQRSLTKAIARHGLGLYVYAGEDLPDEVEEKPTKPTAQPQQTQKIVKDVPKVLAMIKAATTLDELKKIQDGVNASNLYQSEMQENGVLYVAFFNRAQDINK